MGKYTTDPLRTGRKIEKADGLGTLGGEFGLCWNDAVPLTTGAHNAFLSAFFAAGGVFDRLVEPLLDQDYILDMDPTVKPLYGHQEGAAFGYNPQKPGRPSHCYHAFCIARLRLVLGVVVHAGNETAGVYSAEMLDRFLRWLSGRPNHAAIGLNRQTLHKECPCFKRFAGPFRICRQVCFCITSGRTNVQRRAPFCMVRRNQHHKYYIISPPHRSQLLKTVRDGWFVTKTLSSIQ